MMMMDTFAAIEQRRSVKHFDASHQMPDEDLQKLMQATLLSPTSFNIQNFRFVVTRDKEIQQTLKEASWNQAQVYDASAVVLVCADLKAPLKDPKRYWRLAPDNVAKALSEMTLKFYTDNEALQHEEALRSVGIASQTLMLAAKAMGYDTCPMIGFDREKVASLIKLPEHHIIGMMIVVGMATQPARERSGPLPYDELVFENSFPEA